MGGVFHFERVLPCPELADYVDTYYAFSAIAGPYSAIEDTLLPELPNLRFQLSGDCYIGGDGTGLRRAPDTGLFGFSNAPRQVRIPFCSRVFGVGLKPLGWQSIIGQPAADHADNLCDLSNVFGAKALMMRDQLQRCRTVSDMAAYCDSMLLNMLGKVPDGRRAALEAFLSVLGRPETASVNRVHEFAAQLGLSTRQVERATREFLGCSPKLMLRKHRFLTMLSRSMKQGDVTSWMDEADESFYDQSHYIREYRRFTGRSPKQFAKSSKIIQRQAFDTLTTLRNDKPSGLALRVDVR